jgi:hypothetical protein
MSLKDEILTRINYEQYYESKITFKSKTGNNWKALCPFHKETNPSFYVEISSGKWYCHGCATGGDLIAFHMKINNIDFNTAIRDLAKEYGVNIPQDKKSRRQHKYPELSDESILQLHENLTTEDREYLKGRAISDEVIERLKIGHWDHPQLGHCLVWPIRRNKEWYNLRFYRRANERHPKDIRQLSKEQIGHDTVWIFPEPDPEQENIYLFEGETDTMCALSLGLNATTVTGGAGTFRDEFLTFFKNKKVFVCYDIDEAGRIGGKSVATKIARVAKECRIVILDLDKEKYPKGDFNDYIVKEKKTLTNFLDLCNSSAIIGITPEDANVVEDDGAYWSVMTNKKGEVERKRITNFTINLICRYIQNDIVIREVLLISKDGKKSDKRFMSPENMSGVRQFREFCLGSGDFFYTGNEDDLSGIWNIVCSQDPSSKIVRSIYQAGYIEDYDLWLLGNMAIKDGNVLPRDINGINWNHSSGYSLTPIVVAGSNIRGIPKIEITQDPIEKTKELTSNFCRLLIENVGNWGAAFGVALALGSIYWRDLISCQYIGCYPMLFVHGATKSGKTEYISKLMAMYGLEKIDIEGLEGITSSVPITRKMSYYSCLPIFFDEFRDNIQKINSIVGVLRSAYDGSGRSLGAKGTRGIVSEQIRTSAIISGEHIPSDEAFCNRLIPVKIDERQRNLKYHQDARIAATKCAAHVFNIIKYKNQNSVNRLIDKITDYMKKIESINPRIDRRAAKNYAIMLGCFYELVSDDPIIADYVIREDFEAEFQTLIEKDNYDPSASAILDFLNTIAVESQTNEKLKKLSWYQFNNEEHTVSIWMYPLFQIYEEACRRSGKNPLNYKTILRGIKDLECTIETVRPIRIKEKDSLERGVLRRCAVFNTDNIHPVILSWFGTTTD